MGAPNRAVLSLITLAGLFHLNVVRAQVVLNEVLFDAIGSDTGRQVVEIRNIGSETISMGGHWLFLKPASWQFPASLEIDPGDTIRVHINRHGANSEGEYYTGTAGMRNLNREDSISLFDRNLFSSPDHLIDFVEWGAGGQQGEDVAVAAGQWKPLDPVDVLDLREGSSIAYGGSGDEASSWCIDGTPTLGEPNDECTISLSRSPVRFSEVLPGPGGFVELQNTGEVLEDLWGKWLLAGGSAYELPFDISTILLPGEILLVHLGTDGTDGDGQVFTGPEFGPLGLEDSVALYTEPEGSDFTKIIDFVQWGSPGKSHEEQAVQAGIWQAGVAVELSRLAPGGSLAALPDGNGVERWYVDNTPTPGNENSSPPVRDVVLNELLILPGDGEVQAVEILNRGELPVDLSGRSLCTSIGQQPGESHCVELPAGAEVEPMGYLVVYLNLDGNPDLISVIFPPLSPDVDDLALSVTSHGEDPNNILDYLRWGEGSLPLESAASAAGLWQEGESLDVTAMVPESSIAYNNDGQGPSSYRIDLTPSLGISNEELIPDWDFIRTDCNQDGKRDISDPITILRVLFVGNLEVSCRDACDASDDGLLDITDPIYMVGSMFLGNGEFKPPLLCGPDPTEDDLTCESFEACPAQ